jgi:hypothetical protein
MKSIALVDLKKSVKQTKKYCPNSSQIKGPRIDHDVLSLFYIFSDGDNEPLLEDLQDFDDCADI